MNTGCLRLNTGQGLIRTRPHHLGKLCQDPEELSGGLAVVGRVLVDKRNERREDPVDVVALRLAVELLVVVEGSLDLKLKGPEFKSSSELGILALLSDVYIHYLIDRSLQ